MYILNLFALIRLSLAIVSLANRDCPILSCYWCTTENTRCGTNILLWQSVVLSMYVIHVLDRCTSQSVLCAVVCYFAHSILPSTREKSRISNFFTIWWVTLSVLNLQRWNLLNMVFTWIRAAPLPPRLGTAYVEEKYYRIPTFNMWRVHLQCSM